MRHLRLQHRLPGGGFPFSLLHGSRAAEGAMVFVLLLILTTIRFPVWPCWLTNRFSFLARTTNRRGQGIGSEAAPPTA